MRKDLVILIAAIALAGRSGAQKEGENGSAAPADATADNSVPVANGPGALGIAADDLPDFVELPKSARVTTNMRMNDGDKAGGTLTLETAETPAIAIDPKSVTGGVGVSTGVPSRQIAELMALRQCRENGGRTCGVEISYSDQCAALAWGDHYHFVASAQTLSEASDTALRGCASETAKCKIVYSNCT